MDNLVTHKNKMAEIVCQGQAVLCQGRWKTQTLTALTVKYQQISYPIETELVLDVSHVDEIDTAGLWLLAKLIKYLEQLEHQVTLKGLSEKQTIILDKIQSNATEKPKIPEKRSVIEQIGVNTQRLGALVSAFVAFLGEITFYFLGWLKDFRKIRWKAVLSNIDTAGLQASGIVALLSFLIGLVLAYQVGAQLQSYGATIYVVDLLGLSLLREFSPLLTAIIVAGRSGSAFAAQIGTMKLNEEVDALKTLGVSPVEILVLPKVLGLLIALPLLTILASCFALFGGIVMSKMMLGISPVDFIARFGDVIKLKTLLLGEIKTPVFAIMISAIGCFQGFLVTNSAASVGQRTTISVVHSIFMIIVCDALFSIIFSTLGV